MTDVVTWNSSEANMVKEPTIFNDFTYDTETDDGCLTKFEDIINLINDITDDVEDISSKYGELQLIYKEFTNYNSSMDSNKKALTASVNSFKDEYIKALSDLQRQVEGLQQNDATLIDDLESISALLGNITGEKKNNSTEAGFLPGSNQPYQAKHAGEMAFDEILKGLSGYGLTQDQMLKLADALYESADNSLFGNFSLLNPMSLIVNDYDKVMSSLGDDGIGVFNKLLTNASNGLKFNLSKDLLDNFMHDKGMTSLLTSGVKLDSVKDSLQAITNFANKNDISFDTMNSMISGFDNFVTNQVNDSIGSLFNVEFDKNNVKDIWNGLTNFYDYKDLKLTPFNLNSPEAKAYHDTKYQLSNAVLDAIPDKEAAVKYLLKNQLGISNIDISSIDCDRVISKSIANAPKIASTISDIKNIKYDTDWHWNPLDQLDAIKTNNINNYQLITDVNDIIGYMGLDIGDLGNVIKDTSFNFIVDKAEDVTDAFTGWWN